VKFRAVSMALALVGVVLVSSACGGDPDSEIPNPAESSPGVWTSLKQDANATSLSPAMDAQLKDQSKVPSVETLNTMLAIALNPKVPAKNKTNFVEGSQADPSIFDKMSKNAADNPEMTFRIRPQTRNGPKRVNVKFEINLPGNPPTVIDSELVYDDGRWKLFKQSVCPLLSAQKIKTPLCPEAVS